MPEDTCGCGEPIVCLICDACPEHCLPEGRPDLRWEAHESWRLGKGDPTFGAGGAQ